jgi:hypothetical protein
VNMLGETAYYSSESGVVIYTFAGTLAGPHAEPDVFFTSTLYRPP